MDSRFPSDFIFGAATSSFQIEGQTHADGALPSIWDSFCKTKARVADRIDCNNGCNHYLLWEQDIQIMKELMLDSYRFSISWPRILPEGTGKVNDKGLDFYDKLVDKLLDAGISPMITLYHWDLPETLQQKGGWANSNIPDWFANYTHVVAERLADRVSKWITLNEPWIFFHLGMVTGEHAPGVQSISQAALAWKNILLAHSRAVHALRSKNNFLDVGLACNLSPFFPASNSNEDIEACIRFETYHNRLFLDPSLKHKLPEIAESAFGRYLPSWSKKDMDELKTPVDFIGINYYSPSRVGFNKDSLLSADLKSPRPPLTDMNWEIYPPGLYQMLKWVHDTYQIDLYVTENGCSYSDKVENDVIHDDARIDYIKKHLTECQRAIDEGIPLKGYYVWSLLDNFEWVHGYKQRFGLVHVDFNTFNRVIKKSGYFYQDFIQHQKDSQQLPGSDSSPGIKNGKNGTKRILKQIPQEHS